ncbi:DUF2818 family protein [Bordetella genomosp. 9]|uniref:DUF2818 domain-containing protein n=1 Tax=Bordetella genomosp. 9 TaxID=1416803 RepID=A0A1W6YY90_9BORD|nr:DUF2818 family protein [Bordetella genomosp. 9]ARP85849.1 hypothetical protein CAL13_06225 [Bordetella genomosp. 9]ARP89869.1 hypothetical protein CAL14_05815 [Bordetella genomosp. 9]
MSQTLAVWLLIALALVCANLPFVNERVFAVIVWRKDGAPAAKPFWLRLIELLVFYFIVGGLGFAFESALGNRFSQSWEFYVIALCLFLVLAYPGFVIRYLLKRRRPARLDE